MLDIKAMCTRMPCRAARGMSGEGSVLLGCLGRHNAWHDHYLGGYASCRYWVLDAKAVALTRRLCAQNLFLQR